MDKNFFEKQVKEVFGIEINQIYVDNKFCDNRRLCVVGLCYKPGKATCESYISNYIIKPYKLTYIKFKRLSNKKLFTKI